MFSFANCLLETKACFCCGVDTTTGVVTRKGRSCDTWVLSAVIKWDPFCGYGTWCKSMVILRDVSQKLCIAWVGNIMTPVFCLDGWRVFPSTVGKSAIWITILLESVFETVFFSNRLIFQSNTCPKTNTTMEKSPFSLSLADTSSNACVSIVMLVFGGANMQNYSVESVLSPRNLDMLNFTTSKRNSSVPTKRTHFQLVIVLFFGWVLLFFLKTKYNQTQPETSNGQKKHRSRENDGGKSVPGKNGIVRGNGQNPVSTSNPDSTTKVQQPNHCGEKNWLVDWLVDWWDNIPIFTWYVQRHGWWFYVG